jgi:hypothetical protein
MNHHFMGKYLDKGLVNNFIVFYVLFIILILNKIFLTNSMNRLSSES